MANAYLAGIRRKRKHIVILEIFRRRFLILVKRKQSDIPIHLIGLFTKIKRGRKKREGERKWISVSLSENTLHFTYLMNT